MARSPFDQAGQADLTISNTRENHRPDPLDVIVLLLISVFLILRPPSLRYLSYLYGPTSALSVDTLGGAFTGLSTLLLIVYFLLAMGRQGKWARRAKLVLVLILGGINVLLPTASDIIARHDLGLWHRGRQASCAHDGGVLQTEAAVGFLLQGRSPYSADYSETEMAQGGDSRPELWQSLGFEENPAYHFCPYPPLTILLSLPFHLVAHATLGWFDQRIIYVLAWGVLAVLGYLLPTSPRWRLPLMALLIFNPIATMFFVMGRNDILCQTFLLATIYLLTRRHYRASALLLGLSCGIKKVAWVLGPVYLIYLYAQCRAEPDGPMWKQLLRRAWPLLASVGVIFLPFVIWDPKGLYYSLIVAQGSVYPFRSSSLGFATFLILFDAIQSYRDEFPLLWFQVILLPILYLYGGYRLLVRRNISSMLAWYAVTLGVLLFFGRHFAQNYLTLVFAMMAVACVLAHEQSVRTAGTAPPQE